MNRLGPGVDVVDIGLCGTEGVYFATFALGLDGGIMVTASHNPPDYNGMKFVREGSRPISGDTGLKDIEAMVATAMGLRTGPDLPATPLAGGKAGTTFEVVIGGQFLNGATNVFISGGGVLAWVSQIDPSLPTY